MVRESVDSEIKALNGGELKENDKVQMKKQLGLLEGVAIILGIIFGSGNFLNSFR